MILKTKSNKPLFTLNEQMSVIKPHHIEHMDKATNIKEWNTLRQELSLSFEGSEREKLMLFGYIDGVHHADMFGKRKLSQK